MTDNMIQDKAFDGKNYERIFKSDLLKIFESHCNHSIVPYYIDRADRNKFAAAQLMKTDVKHILNIGGGGARHLQGNLSGSNIKVYEIDMQGDCDLKVNIDELLKLPFKDNSFDAVCAFDVLEHLENFHLLNDEMFRVAKDYVFISLPNSATEILINCLRNRPQTEPDYEVGTFSKYYGLPLNPPLDRHRWWIYFQDIIRFYYYFSLKNDASLEFWTPKMSLKKRIFKAIFGSHLYHCFFCPYVWIKISKKKNEGPCKKS